MNYKKLKSFIFYFLLFSVSVVSAQEKDKGTPLMDLDSTNLNWQNLDEENDQIMGISVDKSYNELLKNKKPKKTIVVAIIDGGVDITHEDLTGKIWINTDEIPDNGIDDDNNGYIDDVHGWNFIGNSKGENMIYANNAYTRIVRKYQKRFANIKSEKDLSEEDKKVYEVYKKAEKNYKTENNAILNFKQSLIKSSKKQDKEITKLAKKFKIELSNDSLDLDKAKAIVPKNKKEEKRKKEMIHLLSIKKAIPKIIDNFVNKEIDYYGNINFDPRKLIGDNPDDYTDRNYGNNKVDGDGYGAGHGTFVSGLIAANRNNGIGINGIAESVKIMAIRVVPDGDEYDKDVALAIKYAVDNGADIINMSFGKYYSLNKFMVDSALIEAEKKNVLVFHASGNESANNDKVKNFPTPYLAGGKKISNWLNVGASTSIKDKYLASDFSNYGKKTVDFFAPGDDIISTYPQNTYLLAGGTSFASPIAAGVAALVWSYYPELTVDELKTVLLNSATSISQKVLVPPAYGLFRKKTSFSNLSVTGGIINAYKALKEAEKVMKNKVVD